MKYNKKNIEKSIADILIDISNASDYRKKGFTLYKKKEDYFLTIFIYITGFNSDLISVQGRVKPFWFDDVLWDVINMSSNKKAPISLRAVGAFAIRGPNVFQYEIQIKDISEVSDTVEILFQKCNYELLSFLDKISGSYEEFCKQAENFQTGLYDEKLGQMLLEIYKKDYAKAEKIAMEELNAGRRGNFINEGKDVYTHVIEYCKKNIMDLR